LTSIGM